MSFSFGKVKINPPKRSLFDLSHDVKMSMNMGCLVPFMCQEVIPGDTWKCNAEIFLRFSPMLAPIMHRVNVKTFFHFVPFRLIWDDWKEFITLGENGTSRIPIPKITISAGTNPALYQNGSLFDYLGFPSSDKLQGRSFSVNALPFRAYQLLYNEWFRNQNLQDEIEFSRSSDDVATSGLDGQANALLSMRNINWEMDYFTSCLPWTQRGPDVKIPVGIDKEFPVQYQSTITGPSQVLTEGGTVAADGTLISENGVVQVDNTMTGDTDEVVITDPRDGYVKIKLDDMQGSINDLRLATRLQRWFERNAVAGSRYIEQILSHFGVRSSDARLQRPEFLGGGQSPVVISQVLQQSQSVGDEQSIEPSSLGDMAGHGVSIGKTHNFKKFFEEHGYIIGTMCVVPRTSYQQGMPRQYNREVMEDFYFPEFANLGEQAVLNKEVYYDYNEANPTIDPDGVFGYQQRFAEYRYIPSSVHGDFKSSLDFWHLGRKFANAPQLNDEFVEADLNNDTYNRIFAVTSSEYHHLWCQIYNNIKAARPMPKYPTPTL